MYRTRQIRIKKGHRLYGYCKTLCMASANLYNRGIYLVRQYATALDRMEKNQELTENQQEAYDLIRAVTLDTKYYPKNKWLTYGQLDFILKESKDVAYRSLPAQANQQILKCIQRNFASFFEVLKVYKEKPDSFTGRPKLPGYKKKGRMTTAILTNQICKIKASGHLKFPGTKNVLNLKKSMFDGTLKEVRIKPHTDGFMIDVVLDIGMPILVNHNSLLEMDEKKLQNHLSSLKEIPYRVAAIDPGMSNFCAVANNFDETPFVIKGGIIKSANQFYNKQLAKFRSNAKRCNDTYFTRRIDKLHDKRNRIIKDQMHKISRKIADWAFDNNVDLVVFGHNIFQKQHINMGHENNQNFVQIPFQVFAGMLRYKLNEKGIVLLETEEAYTSAADFFALDPIPKYEKGKAAPNMSGKRIKRGLYHHMNGTYSNADINGAANIMRKVFPNVLEWDRGLVDRPYAMKVV